jgi:hypothetical protein
LGAALPLLKAGAMLLLPLVLLVTPPQADTVRFTTTAIVYVAPDKTAERAGIAGKDTRTRVKQSVVADGCGTRWIEIEPRGWVCETVVEPTLQPPSVSVAPSLADDSDPALGVYGAVYRDATAYDSRADAEAGENGHPLGKATSVRSLGTTTIDGRSFWITSDGTLIEASSIAQMAPSRFHGVALDDGQLAVAWVHCHDKPREPVALHDAGGSVTGEVGPRTRVAVKEVRGDLVRISDTDWIARADLRMPSLAEPPPGVGKREKWFDVDLDEQTLVAYEGARPVYATLVSTGKYQHDTPEAIARISSKLRSADMISTQNETYSVADVPWTMYYDNHFALHTSYWHDGFGDVRSHGCVNLAPRDARALYGWSSPDVPAGWIAVYGDEDNPGSLVRVRSKRVPEPAYRGYAKSLHEAAQIASRD